MAVIFECIETLKPKLVTITPLHRKLKTTTYTFYYIRRHMNIGHNQLYNEFEVVVDVLPNAKFKEKITLRLKTLALYRHCAGTNRV